MSSNDLDDVPILDVINNTLNSGTDRATILVPSLSPFRPTNILRTLALVEFLVILIIWLIGGQNHALIDDIVHFHLTTSIFDLVVISIVKVIFLIILLTELETLIIKRLYRPIVSQSFISNKTLLLFVLTVIVLISLIFSIIKLILVLHHLSLSKLYVSAIGIFFGLSALQSMSLLWTYFDLKQLKLIEQQLTDTTTKSVSLRRLFSLIRPERFWLIIGSVFLLLSSGIETIDVYLFGRVIGLAIEQEPLRLVNMTIVIVLCLDFVASVATVIYSWMFALSGQKMVQRLRQNVFNAIIKQEISFFDENRTGELTNRLSSDTEVVQDSVTGNIAALAQNFIHIVVLIILVPVIVLIATKYGDRVEILRKKFQDQLAQAGTIANESISNIRTIRIFGAEEKIKKNYTDSLLQSLAIGKSLALNDALFSGVLGLLTAGGISGVVWYGAKLVHEKKLSTGVLAAFLLYMLQVAVAFAFLAQLYTEYMQAVGASTRLFGLIDRKPTIPAAADTACSIKPRDFAGRIRFDRVCFTYPTRADQQVLTDISFSIQSGQKIALVGPSGGGKSTIASLIERFYDPQSGTIYLDSSPLSSIDPQWLRQNISFVNQEPSLFACSIRDNITFGLDRTDIILDEITQVAKQANAHEFIEQFEEKYDTLVGERGIRLSGGQRQRLAIARALLVNPKVLLLDEATSALDAESEHLIDEAIKRATINRSVLVIAHRLSTVRNADLVLVIDEGKIVERGTHDSLMNKDDGIYKNLVLRQLMSTN